MKIKSILLKIAIIIISLLLLIGAFLVIWLNTDVGKYPIVSTNITMLRKHVDIDVPAKEVSWEIVGWPDETNTTALAQLEQPSHYALLADFTLTSSEWFDKLEDTSSEVWVSLSIVRSWLFEPFKKTLQKNKGKVIKISELGNCKAYATTVTVKNKKSIKNGFVCQRNNHLLLYLTVSGEAPSDPSIYIN